jgi:signal transduction histidine kinase
MSISRGTTVMPAHSAVIHEIEGRLASIAVFSDELARGWNASDPVWIRNRLDQIHNAASEMQRAIEAVRRLHDDAPLHRVQIDISALCGRVLRRQQERTPDFANAVVYIQSNMQACADLGQMEVLLDNLIGNALKFTSRCTAPEIRITQSVDGRRTLIHVSDNGVGIAPEDAELVFAPFARFHRNFPGTGVGLSTARRIVERHGGRIWAIGEPGLGTTVSFVI